MIHKEYDVIVIGAGHAGLEAGFASAKKGLKTAIITLSENDVGKMPCNPSIGGPAKGTVTREIDALGGMQGKAADACTLQIKMLGTSKGPGVWALRAQIDKVKYHQWFINEIKKQKNLDLIIDEVKKIIVNNDIVTGVELSSCVINCKAVVITSGTYLSSITHRGKVTKNEGADGSNYAKFLSHNLNQLGFDLIRLKTGTPPRIQKDSIDYSKMEIDYGDNKELAFSFTKKEIDSNLKLKQLPCYLIYTNQFIHDLIKNNLDHSAMYSGAIQGIGPRYCPSIEDKIVKFSERERHQIFLEPESLSLETMYLGGFSTSMSIDIQDKMIRLLPGLKDCKVVKYGYAIEYDAIDPTQLYPSLMTKKITGLFTAGQINGTSGYEEAAAQGIIAGINAANYVLKKSMLILNRQNSYIGVMIDDIVTKGVTEPYRLLTSRAEHRLYLRNDNADDRLLEIGYNEGLISQQQYDNFLSDCQLIDKFLDYLNTKKIGQIPTLRDKTIKNNASLFEYLKRPEIKLKDIINDLEIKISDERIIEKIEIKVKFSGYIAVQEEKIKQYKNIKEYNLSFILDYKKIPNLSLEAIDKLNKIKPLSLSQASRISGINIEDILKIKYYLDISNHHE